MITNLAFKNKVTGSIQSFTTQTTNEDGGENNLVVDGDGKGIVTTEADATIVLLAEGDDLVFADSDFNDIQAQAGNNTIVANGNSNRIKTENGDNKISSTGDENRLYTDDGNNVIVSEGSSNFIYTNEGNNSITSTGSGNIIGTENGDNIILSTGHNNVIGTVNGNNNIYSIGSENDIFTEDGNNYISSVGNKNNISSNRGDDRITSTGDGNTIAGGDGNDIIISEGNNNKIAGGKGNDRIKSTGDGNTIADGAGDDNIISIGDKNVIVGDEGDDVILSLGNSNKIGGGEGNNSIVFNGNNLDITAGNGNNYVASLDFAIQDGAYSEYASYLDDQIKVTREVELVDSKTTTQVTTSEKVSRTTAPADGSTNLLSQVPADDFKVLEWSGGNNTVSDTSLGVPHYLVATDSTGRMRLMFMTDYNARKYGAWGGVSGGDYMQVISWEARTTTAIETSTTTITHVAQDITVNTYQEVDKTTIVGNKNINITTGSGNDNIKVNVSENANIDGGAGNNNIFVTGEIVHKDILNEWTEEVYGEKNITTETKVEKRTVPGTTYYVATSRYFGDDPEPSGDPLIIDFNQDGVVSAQAGKGVDINNDGIADGAATGGDKMLAMSDLNGTGTIDGGEVFGDQTINPFTGEKLNAKNGFEALRMMAEQAEQHTGINCLQDGNVNLAELQKALRTVGVNLGFISDDNITVLEDLALAASINVEDYTEHQEEGDVQHNQQGLYTDTEGDKYKAHDVWFKLFGVQ